MVPKTLDRIRFPKCERLALVVSILVTTSFSMVGYTRCAGSLGGEYDSIARAIYHGRGFSDPFEIETGPTAWMPPVTPSFLALLYYLSDGNRATVLAINAIAAFFTVMTCVLAAQVYANKLGVPIVGLIAIVTFMGLYFHYLFEQTVDAWPVLVGLGLVMSGQVFGQTAPLRGICGGIAALISPVLGLVWLATSVSWLSSVHKSTNGFAPFCVSLAFAIAVTVPWCVRNRMYVGGWYPIKSNLSYELWQSFCVADDGLLNAQLFMNHPFVPATRQREIYAELKEHQFIQLHRNMFIEKVVQDPMRFLNDVCNRFVAACVWYQPLSEKKNFATTLAMRLPFGLCFLSVITLLVFGSDKQANTAAPLLVVYFAYLLPYIVVSYYDRYGAPLFAINALIVAHGYARFEHLMNGN